MMIAEAVLKDQFWSCHYVYKSSSICCCWSPGSRVSWGGLSKVSNFQFACLRSSWVDGTQQTSSSPSISLATFLWLVILSYYSIRSILTGFYNTNVQSNLELNHIKTSTNIVTVLLTFLNFELLSAFKANFSDKENLLFSKDSKFSWSRALS